MVKRQREETDLYSLQITDMCRRKLLGYADSFYALAKSYDKEILPETEDRPSQLMERRLWENRRIMRSNMREMAKVMTEVASEVLVYRPMELRRKKKLATNMAQEGIAIENPCYLPREDGRESIVVTMQTTQGTKVPVEDVVDMISVILDKRLCVSAQSPYMVEGTPQTYILEEETRFHVMTGFARAIKEGETASGDNYSVVETERGRLLAMLSDGTGSGETAGKDSAKVLELMEKMAESGYDVETAIDMVNRIFYSLNEDNNHPTLDICEIDLYKGILESRKLGGACTFLKRENRVEPIAENSLPLGMFEVPDSQPQKIALQDGDYLIMMTDGVVEAFGGADYELGIQNAILAQGFLNPKNMADHLMSIALSCSRGRVIDDMTIGVIGIWET